MAYPPPKPMMTMNAKKKPPFEMPEMPAGAAMGGMPKPMMPSNPTKAPPMQPPMGSSPGGASKLPPIPGSDEWLNDIPSEKPAQLEGMPMLPVKGESGPDVAQIKQQLSDVGFYDGPVDDKFDDNLQAAIEFLQTETGTPVTGALDADTVKLLLQLTR